MSGLRPPSILSRLKNLYLSLNLPFRRYRLAGIDLYGNKYYFFRPTLLPSSTVRVRRILFPAPARAISQQSGRSAAAGTAGVGRGEAAAAAAAAGTPRPGSLASFADVSGTIPVQWHQWLRYTREEPPSWGELVNDERRKEGMKILAQRADERWRNAGALNAPPTPTYAAFAGDGGTVASEAESRGSGKEDEVAWTRRERSGAKSGEWQPEAWTPGGGVDARMK